jgi:large subunit ribosomal protein L31e
MSNSEVELERTYTVPLSRAWIAPRYRRTSRAVNVLKEFARRHMKSAEIKIDSDLNEKLWSRGITGPPRRIVVKMTKDEDGLVTISLPKIGKEKALEEPEQLQQDEMSKEEVVEEKGASQKESNSSSLVEATDSDLKTQSARDSKEKDEGTTKKARRRKRSE